MHKTANVLDALAKGLHSEAKKANHAIYGADTRGDALDRVGDFTEEFENYPKAVAKITSELDTCWRSTTTQPNIGSIYEPPTQSSRPWPPCDSEPR